ncbi:MAG: bifunctional oligoribonuclease/PAP phosphatase NrnA [Oscillospiraceae bacterium]|nr:bifunctional oligoribonuclease/PAP phosphatase NrnA [Oscillospiraceae bacterium]
MGETKRLTTSQTAEWLRERDDFLILTHRRPDGDTLGSAAGLAAGLREMGKVAYLLPNPETTPRYEGYVAEYLAPAGFVPGAVLSVDTADAALFPEAAKGYMVDLCIDHHASNTGYGVYTYLTEAASCGEVVYEILMALTGEISAAVATPLYVAITTDTGCFVYANTTADTLETASKLIRAGADYWQVNKRLFRTKSRGRMALDGALFSGLRFYFDGLVAVSVITLALMAETGATEDDLDDIATIPGLAEGVKVGLVVKELRPGVCKVSARTWPIVDANALCQRFGGGGHRMAAGCIVDMGPEETVDALLLAVGEMLP